MTAPDNRAPDLTRAPCGCSFGAVGDTFVLEACPAGQACPVVQYADQVATDNGLPQVTLEVPPDGMQPSFAIRPTGTTQEVGPSRLASGRERMDEALRVARLGGDHVWTMLVQHLVADPASLTSSEGHLDAESIVGVHVGCFRCEQAFDPRLLQRRCPGDR